MSAAVRGKWCNKCRGSGVCRAASSTRYIKCPCGRMATSDGAAKLAKQEKLDQRLQDIKTKGWES